jgi:hypothetical protein
VKRICRVLIVLAGCAWGLSGSAHAGVVTHFGDGPFRDVSTLLDLVGIGSSNVNSETTANLFVTPGAPSSSTDLTFTFRRDTGAFLFSFGFFDISTVSANPITQTQLWATQALANATQVFDDRLVDPGATATFNVNAGTVLGFFLIPNNTLANFNADPGLFFPSQTSDQSRRSPLFSVSEANPGQLDQMLSFVGNGVTLFTFEDLTRTGSSDQDFTDLAFTVDAELSPVNPNVVPEPSTLPLFSLAFLGVFVMLRRKAFEPSR